MGIQKFPKNKYEALKLFLMVRQHNFKKIRDEHEAKLNPKQNMKKEALWTTYLAMMTKFL